MLVDVKSDDGSVQIARIVLETDTTYTVNFLEKNKHHLYDFVDISEVINKESVSGFYDTTNLEHTGLYEQLRNGSYTLVDHSDDEYVLPDDEADDSGSEGSLDDEF